MTEKNGDYLNKADGPFDDCFGLEHNPREAACQQCTVKEDCAESFYRLNPNLIEEDMEVGLIDFKKLLAEDLTTSAGEEASVDTHNKEVTTMAERAKPADVGAAPPPPAVNVDAAPPPVAADSGPVAEQAAAADATEATEKKKVPAGFGPNVEKNAYGFGVNTKGDYIVQLLLTGECTKKELLAKTNEKFGTDSSGRVNMVLYQLKKKGFKLGRNEEGKYKLEAIA